MKILFVCNMGMERSPSAARLWKELHTNETDFMGIYNEKFDHEKKLDWADLIVVMEPHQRKWIADNYPKIYLKKKILCIDVPDIYGFMKPDLVEVLKKKFRKLVVE